MALGHVEQRSKAVSKYTGEQSRRPAGCLPTILPTRVLGVSLESADGEASLHELEDQADIVPLLEIALVLSGE